MVDFRPFRAFRPPTKLAAEVAAVPYDVVNTEEARALVAEHPQSVLRVTRPDVDLPDGADLHAPAAYAQAQAAFDKLLNDGALTQDKTPAYYIYAQKMGDHRQFGLVGLASAADYWADRIKKHEFTRPAKEDDRKRHIEAVRAHLGPVFLTYRTHETIDQVINNCTQTAPEVDFTAPDGIEHTLWPIFDQTVASTLQAAFSTLDALYIADGHHRAAAASRIGRDAPKNDPRGHFLAVAFPHDQLKVLPYNRVVADLNGHTAQGLLAKLGEIFTIEALTGAPEKKGTFAMYLDGQWSRLTLRQAPPSDPIGRLDVSVLQEQVLSPLLGIGDPRTDQRIGFVGGIRGLAELSKRVDRDGGIAFALYPTSVDELMDIADIGEVMPPKSTWFEPKLRSGLVVSRF